MEVANPVEPLVLVVAAAASTAMQLHAEIPLVRGQYAGKVGLLIHPVIGHSKGSPGLRELKFMEAIEHVHVPSAHVGCAAIASYSYGVAAGMHGRRWVV